ncbi:hypothetical protein P7C71_g2126, partial [Lecanoromycetidae sp. Uapishka_2]
MAPLVAFNPPLGPTLSHCHPEQVTLHMKEKAFSLSGDDFTVKTVSGMGICKCKGKILSVSDKKGQSRGDVLLTTLSHAFTTHRYVDSSWLMRRSLVFTDVHDKEIFALKNKHFTIHKSFHAEDPHGKDLFVVKGEFAVLASKSTVHFKNASDGHEVELEVRGDWFDRSANITFGGQPVAHISRSFFNVREIFADKDTYFVHVAPNVDLTMIAALCVCLDEEETEK